MRNYKSTVNRLSARVSKFMQVCRTLLITHHKALEV